MGSERSLEIVLIKLAAILLVAILSFFGAYTSKLMHAQHVVWPYLITTTLTSLLWMGVCLYFNKHNLLELSVAWDVVGCLVWLGTVILVLKEFDSVWQIVGAVVALVGICLMAIK
jgi:hypothetical protein